MSNSNVEEVLHLHDISLLLNYERASTDPKFQHAKLMDIAADGDTPFSILPELNVPFLGCGREGVQWDGICSRLSSGWSRELP
jgi:hypothetical protein